MKRISVLFLVVTGLILFQPVTGDAQELSLKEIMNNHFQACAMDQRQRANTIVMTGITVQQDLMPLKIYLKRPNKYLMEFDVVDLTAYQGFDGDTAWSTAPWTGNTAPRILQGEQAAALIQQADFDGMLWNWEAKGFRMDSEGTDTIEGRPAWRMQLMLPDSTVQYYFIDCQDFLVKKRLSFRTYQGQQLAIETFFRNYETVEGIPFPFLLETRYPGREVKTEIETIELNVPLEDQFFRMPD